MWQCWAVGWRAGSGDAGLADRIGRPRDDRVALEPWSATMFTAVVSHRAFASEGFVAYSGLLPCSAIVPVI